MVLMARGLSLLCQIVLQGREREILLSRLDPDVEPVLPRRERAHVVLAVRAVRVVREGEIEDVLVRLAQGGVEGPGGGGAFLSARGVAGRGGEALPPALPGGREGLVPLKAAG